MITGVDLQREWLVVIGASAGGPSALARVLKGLPADFAAAVVIVQHLDMQFAAGMAEWLNGQSSLPVRVAVDGDRTIAGRVLLAGTAEHLELRAADRLGYAPDPRDHVHRPSIDVLFESTAKRWRGRAIGVLLTGMGHDGAAGLKALRDKGHHTIAQDEATSVVYGMPKAAARMNAAVDVLPIAEVAPRLVAVVARELAAPDLKRR